MLEVPYIPLRCPFMGVLMSHIGNALHGGVDASLPHIGNINFSIKSQHISAQVCEPHALSYNTSHYWAGGMWMDKWYGGIENKHLFVYIISIKI